MFGAFCSVVVLMRSAKCSQVPGALFSIGLSNLSRYSLIAFTTTGLFVISIVNWFFASLSFCSEHLYGKTSGL